VDVPLESALEALPIFPLPDTVLFPGALLPLHVFEPRYRDMTRDVLGGSRMMAVARLKPGYEADYYGRPEVHAVAGVGYVIAAEQLEDGRYNIVLRGVGRIRIAEELPAAHSYRTVRAEMLVDTHSQRAASEVAAAHEQVIAMCDRLSHLLDEGGDNLRELVRAVPSPAGCVDVLAAALVTDTDERQRLLEALDPADRLERLLGHVALLVSHFSSGPKSVN
jgi:Lon protease-like protein